MGDTLPEHIQNRIIPAENNFIEIDCHECDYYGEDMRKKNGNIHCPECDARVLTAEELQTFINVWSRDDDLEINL